MFNEHMFLLDVSKKSISSKPPIIVLGQGDHNAYTLNVQLFDNSQPLNVDNYTVWFEMLLPDKQTTYAQEAQTQSGNTAVIVIDEEKAAAVVGTTKIASIVVRDAQGALIASTDRLTVECLRSPRSGQPAESWISGIDEALAAMQSATESANDAAEAADEATTAANTATAAANQAATDIAAQVTEQAQEFDASQAARQAAYAEAEDTRDTAYQTAENARDSAYQTAEATRNAQSAQATTAANNAASAANTAAGNATTAATNADTATTAANTAATSANQAAQAANTAATNADSAATAATTAADEANQAHDAIEELIEEGLQVPLMTESTRGGAKLGWGLEVVDGHLQVNPSAKFPEKDYTTGLYDNASIKRYFDSMRENKVYTVAIPKYAYSDTIECEKREANAGMVVEPSTNDYAGRDDYTNHLIFMRWDVNGGTDDAVPFVKSIREWDDEFSLHGDNGNVFELTPVFYYQFDTESDPDYTLFRWCDTKRDGFIPRPGALYPDGTERPYLLHPKYVGVSYDGKLSSVSGLPCMNRVASHNDGITQAAAVGAGYSCFSISDYWYMQGMLLMKYGKKSSQAVYSGCTGYTTQAHPTVAETGVKRVIVANSAASALVVGSWMMFGNQATASTDRGNANCYNIFDGARITAIEDYDGSNKAVCFDVGTAFDTDPAYLLSTAPYGSGFLDEVKGCDGTVSVAGRTNSLEPYLVQGIECGLGAYEVVGDVILNAHEEDGLRVDVHINYDSANESTAINSNYTDTGFSLPTSQTAGWLYTQDIADVGGLLVGTGTPGASNKGTGDACYQSVVTSKGEREFLAFGSLGNGADCGSFCVGSSNGLGTRRWVFVPRLSVTGRTKCGGELP